MIDYTPFWNTLKKSSENSYTLTIRYGLSSSTLHRLKHNKCISMKTVNDLCRILNCEIQDIARYVPSDHDQPLKQT
ncbi:MAG: helix-turn-helix domain-containing protein [Eubacteriales bacterium]|nr:helix-turn-helix domain-containing protein [Eubacteriales bacterium]